MPSESLGERHGRKLERRPKCRTAQAASRPSDALAERAELASNDEMDEQDGPIENGDLRACRRAAPRDAVTPEDEGTPERLEPPLRRRRGAERLAVLVQRLGADGPHAAVPREVQPQREVDVFPVREEALVEPTDRPKRVGAERSSAAARANRVARTIDVRDGSVPERVPRAQGRVELDARGVDEVRTVVLQQDARDHGDACVAERLEQALEEVRCAEDVVVDQHDGVGSSRRDSGIDGAPESGVLRHTHASHVRKTICEQLSGAVGRRIVDDDDVVGDRLSFEVLERLGEQPASVEGRNDHGGSHGEHDNAAVSATEPSPDLLSTSAAGGRVVRGGLVRGLGYGVGTLLGAGTSVFLLRHLGRDDFGRYGAVAALLGVVSAISDGGLTAVGARELALARGEDRARLLGNLVSLRLVITPVGIALAALFALIAYDRTMFWGTLLGGVGVLLVNTQATMMMPLSVELRLFAVTAFEVLKAAFTFVAVVILVALGSSLLPFFGAQIPVGAIVLALTPLAVPLRRGLLPRFDRAIVRSLVRDALPLAVALTMNVIYFRVLVIMTSLLSSKSETGFFATSFQVFAVLFSLPLLVLSTALPLLSVAGRDDNERLRFALQRMTEVSLAAAVVFVLAIYALAPTLIPLLGGDQFSGAAPVLQIQSFALIAVFIGQVWQLGLLSMRRQAALAWANAGALAVVLVLGAIFIPLWNARGAAAAAVIGEAVLAVLVYAFLRIRASAVAPGLGLVPRVVVAAIPAFVVVALPLPWELGLPLAIALFVTLALVLHAVPFELMHALRNR